MRGVGNCDRGLRQQLRGRYAIAADCGGHALSSAPSVIERKSLGSPPEFTTSRMAAQRLRLHCSLCKETGIEHLIVATHFATPSRNVAHRDTPWEQFRHKNVFWSRMAHEKQMGTAWRQLLSSCATSTTGRVQESIITARVQSFCTQCYLIKC